MGDFFSDGFPHIFAWFIGAFILGGALLYGVARAGKLKKGERQELDRVTRQRQRSEDPQSR